MKNLVLIYFIAVSAISVALTVHDKRAAIRHTERVSERRLMILSVLGGSVAMYITMRLIRHKTRHSKFMLGIPATVIAQLAVLAVALHVLAK